MRSPAFQERINLPLELGFSTNKILVIRKEFLGFTSPNEMDVEMIAETTIKQCIKYGLNLNKPRDKRQDGCSTVAGKKIKYIFRGGPKQRCPITNTPLLCETRWSAKCKSIRFFAENVFKIRTQLKFL